MKKLLAVFLSITIFFAMVSCDREQQEQEPLVQLKATESYRTLLYMPFYVSLSQGFFAERGIDVTIETAWSQETAFSNLVTGNTAVYLGGPEMAFYHFQQGNKVPLSLLSQVSCSSGCYLLARPADKPFSWQDLKGKTVLGYKDGEIPQILFDYLLKKNNLRPLLDVHIIQNLPYELRTGAFLAGTGHYMLAMEPEAARTELESDNKTIALLEVSAGPLVNAALITTRDFCNENPLVCQKFIEACQAGLDWVNEHTPEEIAAVAQDFFPKEDEKVLLRAVSRYKTLGVWPLKTVVEEYGLNSMQEIMLERKELNSLIPLEHFLLEENQAG